MLSTILVDDEKRSCGILHKLLGKNCPEIKVLGEAYDIETAVSLIQEKKPDIIFLDVEIKDDTGFDLLKRFQPIPFKVIFVTAHLDYALPAIRYSAVDYLLKPVDGDDLVRAVNKVISEKGRDATVQYNELLKSIEVSALFKLAIPVKDGFVYLEPDEIIRMEADRSYTIFYSRNGTYMSSRNIKEFENILEGGSFFRSHNSHLINLAHVKKFLREDGFFALMSDGSKVEISRRRKDEFLSLMQRNSKKA